MADYHPQDTQTEEHPAFLRKRPKEQASRLTLRGHGGALGEQAGRPNLFALGLASALREQLRPLSGALLRAAAARGHFYVAWFWWPAGLMLKGLIGV